jgi:cytochrome oxidase Cu insertion factor (SCO1/SenC/PrrC family)
VRRLALMFLMCLMLGGLGGLLAATVRRPEAARARFTPPRQVAFDFRLNDQNGRPTSLADARGKVVAMTFIYSSCRDLCPAEGNEIAAALKRFDSSGVEVYVVSVDPISDTPARVKEWLERRDLPADRSHYLIGSRAQLRPVWQAYGIVPLVASQAEAEAALAGSAKYWKQNPYRPGTPAYPYAYPSPRPANGQSQEDYPDTRDMQYRGLSRHVAGWDFEHSAYVLLLDKHGVQRVGIPFEQLSPASLARDLRALLAER